MRAVIVFLLHLIIYANPPHFPTGYYHGYLVCDVREFPGCRKLYILWYF